MGLLDFLPSPGDVLSAGTQILGGVLDREQAGDLNEAQKWWGKNSIQMKVKDAQKAGIHPLFALGAQTFSPTPISSNFGDSIARAGQDIGSSIDRAMDREGKMAARLQNQLLASQIARTDAERSLVDQQAQEVQQRRLQGGGTPMLKDTGLGPMVEGQGDSGLYQVKPPTRSTTPPGVPELESGSVPGMMRYVLPGGLPMWLPASDEGVSEVMENVPIWMWPSLFMMNKNIYGDQWAKEAFGMVRGQIPTRRKWTENYSPRREKRSWKDQLRSHPLIKEYYRR